MSPSNFELNVRSATCQDFLHVGRLFDDAMNNDKWYNMSLEKADREAELRLEWIETALLRVMSGRETLLILELSGSKEMVGFLWFSTCDKERKPVPLTVSSASRGGEQLRTQMADFARDWKGQLLQQYGKFMCTC